MAENGGITDDRYITNPLDMAEGKKEYSANEIPTRLSQIWNHNTKLPCLPDTSLQPRVL